MNLHKKRNNDYSLTVTVVGLLTYSTLRTNIRLANTSGALSYSGIVHRLCTMTCDEATSRSYIVVESLHVSTLYHKTVLTLISAHHLPTIAQKL